MLAAGGGAEAQRRSHSPFLGLYTTDGVNTSRDEYTIRIRWPAERFQAAYGPYLASASPNARESGSRFPPCETGRELLDS